MNRIVIIGFGSAGYAAMMAARKVDPKVQVTVIDPKEHDLLHPCGLPYALEGVVDPAGLTQDIHLDRMKVEKVTGRALSIDAGARTVLVETADGEKKVSFDRCLLCPGSRPLLPPIKGASEMLGRGLHTLTGMDDLRGIMKNIEGSNAAVVIGAGAIGLETAVALKKRIAAVTVIEMQKGILPGILDPDMAKTLATAVEEEGITLRLGAPVDEIMGTDAFTGAKVDGGEVKARLGILSAGFAPRTEIAESAEIEKTPLGITVTETMETSVPGIYAAGDAVATVSVIDGKPIGAKLATSAYKQGIIAGINLAGGEAAYRGSAGTFVTTMGSIEVAGTGFATAAAKERGFDAAAGKIKTYQLPEYFPGGDDINIKILVDKKSRRVIGGQAWGKSGAASRINLVSMAVEFGLTLEELQRVEMAYCPAVSEVEDPLMKAADFAARRMKKTGG